MAAWGAKVALDSCCGESDFISVHSPLTADTALAGPREFDLMKEGVFLVNTSRGPVIDEAALVAALRSGKVWGAGLDVMEQDPLPADAPLRAFDNATFTPHVSANSEDSVADLYRTACQIAIDVCCGRWPEGVVNPGAELRSGESTTGPERWDRLSAGAWARAVKWEEECGWSPRWSHLERP
jgi:phosphoglycerate dehydrogenase-like enzyme